MNRRNFFKTVTGIIAGIFVSSKAKAIRCSKWIQIAISNDGNNMTAYIDGRKFKTPPGDCTIAFWVSLDDIGKEKKAHLYSRALSSEEIKKNYNEGII